MAIYYAREDASHGGNNDGTSYTDAWQGLGSITWSSVGAADTLYICGDHTGYTSPITPTEDGTLGNEVTISGNAPEETGTITNGTGGYWNLAGKDYYHFRDISISNSGTSACFYFGATTTIGLQCTNVTFSTAANSAINVQFGTIAHSDWTFTNCIWDNIIASGAGSGSAIRCLMTTTDTGSLTNFTFDGCTFQDIEEAGIHLRTETAAVNTTITNLVIKNCIFDSVGTHVTYGAPAVRVLDQGSDGANWVDGYCYNNTFNNCYVAVSGMSFQNCYVYDNIMTNSFGFGGGCNIFYASDGEIRNNISGNHTTTAQDGCGIIMDFGCNNMKVYDNYLYNCSGSDTHVNSGCGIMLLEIANCEVYNNTCDNNKVGIWYGGGGTELTHDNNKVYNNTCLNCNVQGLYLNATDASETLIAKNNIFTGISESTYGIQKSSSGNQEIVDNNLIYNFGTTYELQTDPGTDLLINPKLDSNYIPQVDSPCIGAGVTNLNNYDFYTALKIGKGNHIGAVWPKPVSAGKRKEYN